SSSRRDSFKVSLDQLRLIDKRHDEVIRRGVIKVAWMYEDSIVLKQPGCGLFFVAGNRYGDVEASSRFDERDGFQRAKRGRAATLDPLLVVLQECRPA